MFRARVFGTLVGGKQIKHMTQLNNNICGISTSRKTFYDDDQDIGVSEKLNDSCQGGCKMIPIHWKEQECPNNKECNDKNCQYSHTLSESIDIMSVEFFHDDDKTPRSYQQHIVATRSGTISGILTYWVVDMLSPLLSLDQEEKKVKYSTLSDVNNWQDHWQQVVYPLPQDVVCLKGDEFIISCCHDGIQISLTLTSVRKTNDNDNENVNKKRKLDDKNVKKCVMTSSCEALYTPQQCTCGWHILNNSERLQMLNDHKRMRIWYLGIDRLMNIVINNNKNNKKRESVNYNVIDLSDGSILGLMAGKILKDKKLNKCNIHIRSLERKDYSYIFSSQLCLGNELTDEVEVIDIESWNVLKKSLLRSTSCEVMFDLLILLLVLLLVVVAVVSLVVILIVALVVVVVVGRGWFS